MSTKLSKAYSGSVTGSHDSGSHEMNDETRDAIAGPYQDERHDRRSSISGELRPMNLMQGKLILVHAALPCPPTVLADFGIAPHEASHPLGRSGRSANRSARGRTPDVAAHRG
jgi:hypothetical protein